MDYQFWAITTTIAALLGLVGYFYRRSKKLEESAILQTAKGIQKSVDNLSTTVKELAEDSKQSFKEGEYRMDKIENRLTAVETACEINHGKQAREARQ